MRGIRWVIAAMAVSGCSETGLQALDKPSAGDTGQVDTPSSTTTTTPPPAPGEPVADAGPDAGLPAGEIAILDGSASHDPGGNEPLVFEWKIVTAPPGSMAVLPVTDAPTVELATDVEGTYELELGVQNTLGLWDSTPDRVLVVADPAPPVADAGPDTVYQPLDVVQLDGTASYDPGGHEPLTYAWTLVSKPANSTAALDDPTSPTPRFLADLAGDYIFDLTVTSTIGLVSAPDQVVITTTPADGFYVELSWATQADLDLHLLNSQAASIFDCPHDCNYDRPTPNWGGPGAADDPSLDEDTIPGQSGSGPEIITIDAPANDTYTVMVHYYGRGGRASCSNCPLTDATVNIYLGGVLAYSAVFQLVEDDDVWNVATIEWPSGLITPIDTLTSTGRRQCY